LRLELALCVTFRAIVRTSASSSGVGFKRVMMLTTSDFFASQEGALVFYPTC
jgi:hypothetical protein